MNICNVLQRVLWERMEEEEEEEEAGTWRNWETRGVNAGALPRTRSLKYVVVRGLLFWGLNLQPLSLPHLYCLYVRPTPASSECLFVCSCGRRIDKRTNWDESVINTGDSIALYLCVLHTWLPRPHVSVCVCVCVCLSLHSDSNSSVLTNKPLIHSPRTQGVLPLFLRLGTFHDHTMQCPLAFCIIRPFMSNTSWF